MEREQSFIRLTNLLAKYEPGNLLLLSDIMDGIQDLSTFYETSPGCTDFLSRIQAWVKQNLSGQCCPDFATCLGKALELLEKWKPDLKPEAKSRIEAEMSQFAMGIAPADPAKPSAKQVPAEPTGKPKKTTDAFMSPETFAVFITDAKERLSQAQELLLILETHPNDPGSLTTLFRIFHTIKGESGFLHLTNLGELTHRMENILDLLRDDRIVMDSNLVDILLTGIDNSRRIVDGLEDTDADCTVDSSLEDFLAVLDGIVSRVQPPLGKVLVEAGKLQERDVAAILAKQKSTSFSKRFGEIAVKEQLITDADLNQALGHQAAKVTEPEEHEAEWQQRIAKAHEDEIIKVRVGKVNFLVDMIGELTIALGQLREDSLAMSQVKKITRSLQFGSMELRTDTMQGLFNTAHRIIRDLSHNLGKQVTIKTEGEHLEIDRNLIKNLEEPLMHLVRNSLDHGLESSEERVAAGKPVNGTVAISAVRHGSTIVITVEDDGQGLDREGILSKAIERGLVSPDQAAGLSDAQVYDFIFQPGFSTSTVVSQVSGRGVGMDIVRTMVTASRGSLRINTQPGKGTAIVMTFPISTAIIDGLLIRVAGNTLIVPVTSVVESLKINISTLTRVNGQAELITIRDKVMPVIRLERVLGMEFCRQRDVEMGVGSVAAVACETKVLADGSQNIIGLIVENAEHLNFFLVIDEVIAKKEVVVKPLGPRFRSMRGITAGTVLAGGAIGLVLDIDQVVALDK